jgi:P27 family predicted phage terminase small subunit
LAGRKVISIAEKKAKGTYRSDRDRGKPEISQTKPVPPDWLNDKAKVIFNQIVFDMDEIGLASSTYTGIIALLACRQEELERLDGVLNKDGIGGYVYVTTNSFGDQILKENPLVGNREKAARQVQALRAELGLTPTGINKVGAQKRDLKPKNEFDGL